jgi:hypothetical protein
MKYLREQKVSGLRLEFRNSRISGKSVTQPLQEDEKEFYHIWKVSG